MGFTHLQFKAEAVELDEKAIERRERICWPRFPEIRRREPRFADDMVEFAGSDIEMEGGAVEDPAPLPPAPMGFHQQGFPSKHPGREEILVRLLAGPLEGVQFVCPFWGQVPFDVDNPGVYCCPNECMGACAHANLQSLCA